jgi:hypothetical protein
MRFCTCGLFFYHKLYVSVFLQQTRTGAAPRWRLAVCAAALAWHIVSGVCFLVMLLQGVSYNVPILTYNLW